MDYTDWLILKFVVVCAAAFIYKFWLGFTGRE